MEKNESEHRFSLIPVPLIRRLYTSKNAYNEIISYGICDSAFRMFDDDEADLESACKHAIYCYFRKRDNLTSSITATMEFIEGEEDFLCTDRGGDCFDTYGNINSEMVEAFYSYATSNESLKNELLEWYKITKTLDMFRMSAKNINALIDDWKGISASISSGTAFCPISLNFIIDWRDHANNEEENARLAMLMGIASIIGMKKKYALTTKSFILARMFGCNTVKELELLTKSDSKIMTSYMKYSSRRIYEKLRDSLLSSGRVKVFLGYGKRTIVSTHHDFESIKTDLASRYKRQDRQSMKLQRDELKVLIDSS